MAIRKARKSHAHKSRSHKRRRNPSVSRRRTVKVHTSAGSHSYLSVHPSKKYKHRRKYAGAVASSRRTKAHNRRTHNPMNTIQVDLMNVAKLGLIGGAGNLLVGGIVRNMDFYRTAKIANDAKATADKSMFVDLYPDLISCAAGLGVALAFKGKKSIRDAGLASAAISAAFALKAVGQKTVDDQIYGFMKPTKTLPGDPVAAPPAATKGMQSDYAAHRARLALAQAQTNGTWIDASKPMNGVWVGNQNANGLQSDFQGRKRSF